ncbi:hypothetical protein PGT21_021482 [Puccinia graminis f. sp. tritici]|uniref:Uncharacterized protein n=1 Tax=Puccinia graminis f. sp. tritici TaxID=56615 RepID=A0A5B0RL32_PUCGR|nr:hypothetical protein PGT21_021482 [Puccinia graminis f. sp. tritici]KAA1125424.1 hypothetical protein PGTUg99_009430 [Puccinia graminis f. sp. tritici]
MGCNGAGSIGTLEPDTNSVTEQRLLFSGKSAANPLCRSPTGFASQRQAAMAPLPAVRRGTFCLVASSSKMGNDRASELGSLRKQGKGRTFERQSYGHKHNESITRRACSSLGREIG